MKYAILDLNFSTVLRVVPENSGEYINTPPERRILIADGEWCQPRATYNANAVPRFQNTEPRQWTAFQFLNRFTDSELMDIRSRSVSDPIMWKFLTFATAAQEVISNDPVTVSGMDYLVLTGVLSQTRRNEILGG